MKILMLLISFSIFSSCARQTSQYTLLHDGRYKVVLPGENLFIVDKVTGEVLDSIISVDTVIFKWRKVIAIRPSKF